METADDALPPKTKDNFIIPFQVDVVMDMPFAFSRVQRQYLTCFRCGMGHHYKSECGHFRTKLCLAWMRGQCEELYCSFAHGNHELRRPWVPVCVRVIKVDGKIRRLGCGESGHTYRSCTKSSRSFTIMPNTSSKLPSDTRNLGKQQICVPCN